MKPMNFPGRKNARRRAALLALGTERADEPFGNVVARNSLLRRVISDEAADAIRTKKDRSDRAKFRAA